MMLTEMEEECKTCSGGRGWVMEARAGIEDYIWAHVKYPQQARKTKVYLPVIISRSVQWAALENR